MIKITIPKEAIELHKNTYCKEISQYLRDVINSTTIYIDKNIPHARLTSGEKSFLEFILQHINEIMIADPHRLEELIELITTEADQQFVNNTTCRDRIYKKILPKIFDYESFRDGISWRFDKTNGKRLSTKNEKWNGNIFIEKLGVRCCPYCNRAYVFSVKRENSQKTVKPCLDHFFSQSRYPYLGVSIYNLVPCCTVCNSSLKGNIDFNLKDYLHPYCDEHLHDHFKVNIATTVKSLKGYKLKDSDIEFVCSEKVQKHVNDFALKEFYKKHLDYIQEIVIKINDYGDKSYWDSIKRYDVADPLQLLLGNFWQSEDINKRPLAKITADLCEQYGISIIDD